MSTGGLAVERQDQRGDTVDVIELVLRGGLAEALAEHLVEGRLEARKYEINAISCETNEVVVDGVSFLDPPGAVRR